MTADPREADMIRLYAEGNDLRGIGKVMGCSHERVRLILRKHDVPARARGPTPRSAGLSDLAKEVFDDLEDKFEDGATLSALVEWLGEQRSELRAALGELIACGWATVDHGGRYYAATPEVDSRAERIETERVEVQRLLALGRTYVDIANSLGMTKGQVAGIAHRSRKTPRPTP